MRLDPEAVFRLRSAFPKRICSDVRSVLDTLAPSQHEPTDHDIGPITVGGEVVRIPARVYFGTLSAADCESFTDIQRQVLACLFTRHHDGRIREAAVARVIASTADWTPPFVIQLIGEYVIEIVQLLEKQAEHFRRPPYYIFARENPAFMELTRQRATSYWDRYFREMWSRREDYPGLRLLDILTSGAEDCT